MYDISQHEMSSVLSDCGIINNSEFVKTNVQ